MKKSLQPECRVAPAPVVIVSCAGEDGNSNLITCAWSGNICSDPPMAFVSIRPERYSHDLVISSGEFALNLCSKEMVQAADICGMYSGRTMDKWEAASLTKCLSSEISAPIIEESPISIECKVRQVIPLGSHDMFIGEIVAIDADEKYIDEYGRLRLDDAGLLALVHQSYFPLSSSIQNMGYTIRKKTSNTRRKNATR